MAIQEKAKLLADDLDHHITDFKNRLIQNRRKAFGFRIAITLCSALTTILIGFHSASESFQPIIKDFALTLSAFVAAISALDGLFNHRAMWIRYTLTTNELKSLRLRLNYLKAEGEERMDGVKIDALFENFQKVLQQTNADWLQLRKQTDTKGGHDGQ